ncbi:ABC transporter permease [Enterococcus casseliflavus]|uniref:ABC transporter permease n=1 Tax=Enterococcus TaxID=1350 RepID=UPI0018844FB9|nr:ABC transporter permease [Enterococcus casseliflavus]MBE9906599.1 FtsX-like permease family protein [Enterococcus casseliflavus]
MNFRQLIIRNLRGNFRTYAAYFVSSAFAAMVFYIFSLLLFHPQLEENLSNSDTLSSLAKVGLSVALVVIALLSLLFLWYTFVVFLKRRKRDLAIYLILGIEEKDLRKILFVENALLGTGATVTGIGLGILVTKLLLLIAQNVMYLTEGLKFMVPMEGLGLTFGIYVFIFLLISFFSTRALQGEQIISLIKENEKPRPEPKSHWALAFSGIVLLLVGYGSVFYFSYQTYSMLPLMLGVLLTVAGTILSFHQFSVFLLKRLKKRPTFLRGTRMLTISEWIFRMRDNAAMYSLIAISTSVAFVGISVMLAIGSSSFSSIQGISVAYVFPWYDSEIGSENKIVEELKTELENQGYHPRVENVSVLWVSVDLDDSEMIDDPYFTTNSYPVMRESDYQKLMTQIGEEADTVADEEVMILSSNYSRRKVLQALPKSEREKNYSISLNAEIGTKKEVTFVYSPSMLSLDYYGLGVVTDASYDEWIAELNEWRDGYESGFTWLDYAEWAETPELVYEFNRKLDKENALIDQQYEEISQELVAKGEYTDEEWTEATKDIPVRTFYTSKYQVFQENRQGNGIILMITVLLGSVFFIFSASIIYFRLFADLDKDGAYHRSLHILGVSPNERHNVLRRQLQVMYFLPTVVAMIHFAVAMTALRILVELPVWQYYGVIVSLFLIFQIVFYFVCQYRYFQQIDRIADPTE